MLRAIDISTSGLVAQRQRTSQDLLNQVMDAVRTFAGDDLGDDVTAVLLARE